MSEVLQVYECTFDMRPILQIARQCFFVPPYIYWSWREMVMMSDLDAKLDAVSDRGRNNGWLRLRVS